MAFTRYFDNDIKEWIETQGEYDIAYTISNMELKDLDEFMGLLKAEATDLSLLNLYYEDSFVPGHL